MRNRLLLGILAVAFLLRIVGLTNHPAGFTQDEASFGYDAYSILKTGKDQWGEFLPITLRSFGDFKMPLYSYLTIPFIALLGLNEFAVRLPNAILGSFAVLVVYFLAKELFEKNELKIENWKLGIAASLLLALSPWHIPLSRGAFEANLTTFFLPLGILFFIKGLKEKKFFVFAALAFGLNLFTYHSARFVTPFVLAFLIISYRNKLDFRKQLGSFTLLFGLFLAVAIYAQVIGSSRITTVSIFNPTGGWHDLATKRYNATLTGLPDLFSRTFNNKVTYFFEKASESYLSYFSPQFLFTEGPREFTYGMVPGVGVLYPFEIIFLIMAFFLIATKKVKNIELLLFWLFISAVPAALTKGPGHAANRAAVMMPAIQIISAVGGVYFCDFFVKKWKVISKRLLLYCYIAILLISFSFFFEEYFFQQPIVGAKDMFFGTRQVFEYLSKKESQYNTIIISKSLSEPQIYVAFYNKVDPNTFQNATKNWLSYESLGWVDQLPSYSLGKYIFKSLDINKDLYQKDILIVAGPDEFPKEISPSYVVNYPNGKEAFWIVDTSTTSFAYKK